MSTEPTLRKLPVDLDEIGSCACSTDSSWSEAGVVGYVDTQTGAVHPVSVEALRAAEEGEASDELPEWAKDDYKLAVTILRDRSERYHRVEPWEGRNEYRLME